MQLPPPDPDTLFDDLLQDLPSETVTMARECKAFVRAKQVKTPQQLLRMVFLYCGLDKSLRETAADFTLLYETITDSSIAERLAACRPWVQAVLAKMLHTYAVATLPAPWRLLVIDGSHVQGPGAQGPPVSPTPLYGLGPVTVCLHDRHGSAYRRKSRPLSIGTGGYRAGRPWPPLCSVRRPSAPYTVSDGKLRAR
jgi:hypothetical protein